MKRIALIPFAAIAALISCQKEKLTENTQSPEPLVFTANIASEQTKTTLSNDTPVKIYWESTDKITITDASNHVAVYKLSSGSGTASGTFIKESGDDLDVPSTYTATYGTEPSTNQVYSASGSVPLYMTAPSTSSTEGLMFEVQCGILRVTLTDAAHKIMRVEVSDGTDTYKVTAISEVDVTSATNFYLALPAGTYTTLNIYDNNREMVSKTGLTLEITAGHIKPAINTSTLSFVSCTTKGFCGVHAYVQLWEDGVLWAETNIGATVETDFGHYFAWGHPTGQTPTGTEFSTAFNTTNYPNQGPTGQSVLGPEQDMATVNWGNKWRTPDADMLDTLFNVCDEGYCSVTFVKTGIKGVRISGAEDGYKSNSIFLPAAGYGNGNSLLEAEGEGFYWSRTHYNQENACLLKFDVDSESINGDYYHDKKFYGLSVRPIR